MAADFEKLKELNIRLWQRVQTLELQANQILKGRKRDEKLFKKQLLRVSKYLDSTGFTADQVK